MLNFIRYNLAINGMETSSQTLLSIIENKLKSRIPADQASSSADVHFRVPPPKPIISADTWDPRNLAQMSALELARQLTLLGTCRLLLSFTKLRIRVRELGDHQNTRVPAASVAEAREGETRPRHCRTHCSLQSRTYFVLASTTRCSYDALRSPRGPRVR